MKVYHHEQEIPKNEGIVLTIGYFDGVHLGHQAVLKRARDLADEKKGCLYVITFSRHPVEVLFPETSINKICTLEEKLKLLEESKVDATAVLEFTKTFSRFTAKQFLENLHASLGFSALVLGHDAILGNDRQGNGEMMLALANKLGYTLEYIAPYSCEGNLVSSSAIRKAILEGDLNLAEKMLGRRLLDSFYVHKDKKELRG